MPVSLLEPSILDAFFWVTVVVCCPTDSTETESPKPESPDCKLLLKLVADAEEVAAKLVASVVSPVAS